MTGCGGGGVVAGGCGGGGVLAGDSCVGILCIALAIDGPRPILILLVLLQFLLMIMSCWIYGTNLCRLI